MADPTEPGSAEARDTDARDSGAGDSEARDTKASNGGARDSGAGNGDAGNSETARAEAGGAAPAAPAPVADGAEGPDAVEQVQRAVLTLIGAARVALDALEHVVADRRRLDDLAGGGREVVDTLRATVTGRRGDAKADPDDPPTPAS